MEKRGKLYGVGVGSGDPELMTLKAVRIIKECDILALPKSGDGEIVAYEIAKKAVPDLAKKEVMEILMPMVREKEKLCQSHDVGAEAIAKKLDAGKNIAFLTLGDPTIYSTYIYLHKRLTQMGYATEMISGIPSFCAVAAKLNIGLAEGAQPLHIIPASYSKAEEMLLGSGTKVLMKTGKKLEAVKALLKGNGTYEKAQLVQKCGMDGEKICHSLDEADDSTSYFSIIVVSE